MGKEYKLADLGMAYRKAKADLFYALRVCQKDLSDFERDLEGNLKAIQKSLKDENILPLPGELWTLIPKIIDNGDQKTDMVFSNPQNSWGLMGKTNAKAKFRLMEKLPINFHVISALWINNVGHKFEAKLTEAARGNRLRRNRQGEINPLSLGSTVPYIHAYCKWRDDAFVAIEQALQRNESVVAVTADVSSFYHKLDVNFMVHEGFIKDIGVELDEGERELHEMFIKALSKWATNTPLKRGLPVGMMASSLIANVALFELDKLFEEEIAPLYYGRYVDDIILVIKNGTGFESSGEVWDWLLSRMKGALEWKDPDKKDDGELLYIRDYLEKSEILKGSEILFSREKSKTFVFSGDSGWTLLKSFRSDIMSRTSEWRSLPEIPRIDQLESAFLSTIQRDGTPAGSLSKTGKISVQRAEFALKLQDLEAYSRALPHKAWEVQRQAFWDLFTRHILVLPVFFDFFNYLPRVLSLAVHCADFSHLRQMIDALETILKQLADNCDCSINAISPNEVFKKSDILAYFSENLKILIRNTVESSFPLEDSEKVKRLWEKNFTRRQSHKLYEPDESYLIQGIHKRYVKQDLAYRPLRQYLLPLALSGVTQSLVPHKDLPNMSLQNRQLLLESDVIDGCQALLDELDEMHLPAQKPKFPSGLLFPVRPLGIHDLYLILENPFSERDRNIIKKILYAMRGFKVENALPLQGQEQSSRIKIKYDRDQSKPIRIAVTSWKTEYSSWRASMVGDADPDKHRLERFNRLINQVLNCRTLPNYLILPELSVPARWFLETAGKLQKRGISLICGVEYQHADKDSVRNQTWAALSHDALAFRTTMIYRQDKLTPALHEERDLIQIAGKSFARQPKPWTSPPVIEHGDFQFAMLVCSELTNIKYQTELRGRIDALFVPEWNRDIETFSALIESAAIGIHAYIIQCNDRQYGDSRIRAPHKDSWKRDIIRIKGGVEDYFAIGEIDIYDLRAFQSAYQSPDKPFKPVPDGFKISNSRKTLPKGNNS